MKIGELAARTHTPVETIRYYEREGLLPEPARTLGNYRVYGEAHAERLLLVRNCRALDMTLDEIRRLLQLCVDPVGNCGEINTLLDEHIGHVAARIAELKALQKTLKDLRQLCGRQDGQGDCGILQGLASAPGSVRRESGHKHGRLGPTHG
ncbi:HTH-type transcriptional regulator ZntR [Pigmentiphaga humi]|uniref:HTH-type transcriptional regulator ZntR n=1 Tax=Pigmentiphaga humi TaxID=2478468 RepID=A0A3P4B8Y1_9BURK|nr:Cd(II)/Pb(II)-responsive transcriptional regulator [Pigmentiphaga humi]VCU72512.1 HTH-type transcriptional regulator ZntR [Pigmentiphaga humi]